MVSKKVERNIRTSVWTLLITISTTIAGFSMIQVFEVYDLSPFWGVALGVVGVVIGSYRLYMLNKK